MLVKPRNQVRYEQKDRRYRWMGSFYKYICAHLERRFMEGGMKCTVEEHVHLNFYTSKRNFKKEYKVIRPAGKL